MKKVISFFLVFIIIVSALPLTVFASYSLGDINNDGKVNTKDARLILRYTAKLEKFNDSQKEAGNINHDGNVNTKDARIILRVTAKLESIDKYDTSKHKVTFDMNYSNAVNTVDSQYVADGERATAPIVISRENYYFLGWYESKGQCVAWDFSDSVTKDITLYAKWFNMSDNTSYIDTDGDLLPDTLEKTIGTDVNKKDTDSDGLTDYQETIYFNYNPCKADTDNNGIKDCNEDYDSDGLTNAFELSNNSAPVYADTDSDGLNDYDEIKTYKTKPYDEDTDNDDVTDNEEIKIGSNPLVYEEIFTTTVSNGSITKATPVALKVSAKTAYYSAGTVEINQTDSTFTAFSPAAKGYIAPGYSISADDDIKEATLTFTYDKSLIKNGFKPAVYYYNENTSQLEEVSSKDDGKGTVTATVTHFSDYALMDKSLIDTVKKINYNSVNLSGVSDTNNDGINDYYEKLINDGNLLYENTYWLQGITDMYGKDCDDWDGDGLKNGEEISVCADDNNNLIIKVYSNPLLLDSDNDGFDDYSEVKRMETDPLKYDHEDITALKNLETSDAYLFASDERDWCDNIAYGLYLFSKYDTAKESLINFIYDYAPETTIEENAQTIANLESANKALECVEAVSIFLGIGKTYYDTLSTGLKIANFEDLYYENMTVKKNMINDLNKSEEKTELIASELKLFTFPSEIENAIDVLKEETTKDNGLEQLKEVENLINLTSSALGIYEKLCNYEVYDMSKSISEFIDISGSVTNTVSIPETKKFTVVMDIINGAVDTYKICTLYGKVTANADAFNDVLDILVKIKDTGSNPDYVRNAASDLAKIIADSTSTEFFKQLSDACGKEIISTGVESAIGALAKENQYVLILEIFIKLYPLTGVSSLGKSLALFDTMRSFGNACTDLINSKINREGDYFEYDINDSVKIENLMVQLAQSRIIGEKYWYEYLTDSNGATIINSILSGVDKTDNEKYYKNSVRNIYDYSNRLGLTLSSKLPYFSEFSNPEASTHTNIRITGIDDDGKWTVDPDSLPDLINDVFFNWNIKYDYTNPLGSSNSLPMEIAVYALAYNIYDNESVSVNKTSTPDPLKKYKVYDGTYSYRKFSAETLKWIAKNIYHISDSDYYTIIERAKK